MAKRIGIIGSRRRDARADYEKVEQAFWKIYKNGDWLVSGHCREGGDKFCEMIMEKFGVPTMLFPARWQDPFNNWKYNKRAGFERNAWIAENSDIIIACVASDRSGGTENTLKEFMWLGHTNDDVILV